MIKITKKVLSLILAFALVLAVPVSVSASEGTRVFAADTSVLAGDTVSVSVKISGNTGFMGFSIVLNYDETVLTPVSANAGDLLANGMFNDSIGAMQPGMIKIVYSDTANVVDDGELFTVDFEVSENAIGDHTVEMSYIQADTFDENYNKVAFECGGFVVSVNNESLANAAKISSDPLDVKAGFNVTVPIKLENGIGMNSFELEMIYDKSVFSFREVRMGYVLCDGICQTESSDAGIIINWSGSDVAQDGILLYVTFGIAIYTEMQANIKMQCESASFANNEAKLIVCDTININITNPFAAENAVIYTANSMQIINGTVEVPVYIRNNHGLMGFGINIEYDSTIMAPAEVIAGDVISNGYCDNNMEKSAGVFKIIWNSSENVSANGLLFTIKFSIPEGTYPETVPFSLSYVQADTYNENWEDVALDFENSAISIKYFTATFVKDGEVIGTDSFRDDDISLDFPYIQPIEHYEWEWNEYVITSEDITVEGCYVPVVYTVEFVSDGNAVKIQEYTIETKSSIIEPELSLPPKTHYTSAWEDYSQKIGNITVNEIYVPVKYTMSFYCQSKLVATRTYTIENNISQIVIPDVPTLDGYTVEWPSFSLEYKNANVYAVCTPIVYTAQFVADGEAVATRTFTVETEKLDEPPVPQKAGYIACWNNYEIKAKNIVITAKYYAPEAVLPANITLAADKTTRIFVSCNFDSSEKIWISGDTSVATVDNHGNITAIGEGECTITVTCYGKDSQGNEIKASAKTKVKVCSETETQSKKQYIRNAFNKFFEVTLYDIVENLKRFIIVLLRYAY